MHGVGVGEMVGVEVAVGVAVGVGLSVAVGVGEPQGTVPMKSPKAPGLPFTLTVAITVQQHTPLPGHCMLSGVIQVNYQLLRDW